MQLTDPSRVSKFDWLKSTTNNEMYTISVRDINSTIERKRLINAEFVWLNGVSNAKRNMDHFYFFESKLTCIILLLIQSISQKTLLIFN